MRVEKLRGHSVHFLATLNFVDGYVSNILVIWTMEIKSNFLTSKAQKFCLVFKLYNYVNLRLAKLKPHFRLSITWCKGIPRGLSLELFCILIIQWFKSQQQHHLLGSFSWNKCFYNSGNKKQHKMDLCSFPFFIEIKRKLILVKNFF